MLRATILIAAIATVVSPLAVIAQTPREVTLSQASARYPGEFSLLRGVRELANGSVLVVDPIDKVLLRIDPALRRADTLGRQGRGPGEYVQPDGIWPLPADSSLLVDLGNNRLTVVDPSGRLAGSMPIIGGGGEGGGPPPVMLVAGVDARGGLWFRGGPGRDSTGVFRFDRARKASDQVAMILAPPVRRTESGEANARAVRMEMIPLGAQDGWAVASNGMLYIVRAPGYRIDAVAPGGARVTGQSVSFSPVRITDAEKTEWIEEAARSGAISIGIESNGSEQSFSLARQRAVDDRIRAMTFPATKPPFDAGQLFVDTKDRLWVRRHEAAGRVAAYDVFDARGNRVAVVRLPAGRSIVGFGARGVYLRHVDEDDLMHLERYVVPV